MSDFKTKLQAKKADIERKFKALDARRIEVATQRKEIDRQLSQIAEELVRIQGEFRMVEELNQEDELKQEPTKTIPKKSN